jgi:hypothetical protein
MKKILILFICVFSFQKMYSQNEVLYCFDFGGAFQRVAPGYTPVTRVYHSPKFLWIDNVTECVRQECRDDLLRDFVSGKKGEFWVGLEKGTYSVTLFMYDYTENHGAFDIYIQDEMVKIRVSLTKGKLEKVVLPALVKDSVLRIRFVADSGKTFCLNGLIISGKHNAALTKIFKDVPDIDLPSVDEVIARGKSDPKKALEQICDWFVTQNLPNGFLGDFEPGNISQNLWWYSSAYPIRTLLAGYELFKKPIYLEKVTGLLDKLVTEQMPSGAFQQVYRNKPTKDLTQKDIDFITKNYWMNIADIGCIVTALGITTKYVDGERKAAYTNAVKKYCDEWAIKWQKPNGGFTNGLENGVPQKEVYHVATSTSCAAYTVAYAITGEEKYLKIAEKAGEFLLNNWNSDGRPIYHAHYGEGTAMVFDQPVNNFGSAFYYSDGLLMLYHHTKNRKILDKMKEVYSNYIKGEKGLLVNIGDSPWFMMQDAWNNSKTAGMPLVFLVYSKMVSDPVVEKYNLLFRKFLCTPEYSEKIGVMIKESYLPWGIHTLQSWSACSMSATGFAGISLSEMIKPGLIFLK